MIPEHRSGQASREIGSISNVNIEERENFYFVFFFFFLAGLIEEKEKTEKENQEEGRDKTTRKSWEGRGEGTKGGAEPQT